MNDRHQRALDYVVGLVKRLRPGERITISGGVLSDINGMSHNGYSWTPADRVLENVIGSGYEFRYHCARHDGNATFERLDGVLKSGCRSYVSPDRRHLYVDCGGLWMPKAKEVSEGQKT